MEVIAVEDMDTSDKGGQLELSCQLCKLSYSSESELNDHNWSLMHHIKVEQKNKGSIHNCTLCFTTSPNIIEYGKHLNGDKHKRAIEDSRRQKEEEDQLIGKNMLLAKLKHKQEETNYKDKNKSELSPGPNSNKRESYNQKMSNRGKLFRGHQRSFSSPTVIASFEHHGNKKFNGNNNQKWKNNERAKYEYNCQTNWQDWEDPSYGEFISYHHGEFRPDKMYNQSGKKDYDQGNEFENFADQRFMSYDLESYEMQTSRNNLNSFENPAYHRSHDKFLISPLLPPPNVQRQPTDYLPPDSLPNVARLNERHNEVNRNNMADKDSYHQSLNDDLDHFPTQLKEGLSYEKNQMYSTGGRPSSQRDRIREITQEKSNSMFKTPDGVDSKSRTHNASNDNSPEDSSALKRRRGMDENYSRKERRYDSPSQSPSRDFLKDSPRYLSRENSSQSGTRYQNKTYSEQYSDHRERHNDSRREQSVKSAEVNKHTRRDSVTYSDQNGSRRSVRFSDEVSSDGSKVTDEADSTTDVDLQEVNTKSKTSKEKKSNRTVGGIMKKKKSKSPSSSPKQSPKSSRKVKAKTDEGSSVLEKAEQLCKTLREKREKAKKEREKKEKQQKLEKQEELNEQLKALSEKNKEYLKGHVSADKEKESARETPSEEKHNDNSSVQSASLQQSGPVSTNNGIDQIRKEIESSVKPQSNISLKSSQLPETEPVKGNKKVNTENEVTKLVLVPPKVNHTNESDIEKEVTKSIPQKINNTNKSDTGKEVTKNNPQKVNNTNESDSESKVRHGLPHKNPTVEKATLRIRRTSSQSDHGSDTDKTKQKVGNHSPKPREVGNHSPKPREGVSRESLLKMVNSPRSRKERLKLAEMLRSYASTQNRLSLPRFNLQMTGDLQMTDKLETNLDSLHLEELSPDVQLQIAQLIENDVKPDLNDLEKALFSDYSNKDVKIGKEYARTDSNEISSTTSTMKKTEIPYIEALDQFQELNSVLEQENRNRRRMLSGSESTLTDSQTSHIGRNVCIKDEPVDSGYEKSMTVMSSEKDVSSMVVSSSGVSDMDTTPITKDNASGEKKVATNSEEVMTPSTVSSVLSYQSAESIFDTVYEISVKEETLRNELKDVYGQIDYLKKVIEEASIQLNRYTEKKLRLEHNENQLRKERMKLLQDAKAVHRSNQATPLSSDVEMLPDSFGRQNSTLLGALSQTEMSQPGSSALHGVTHQPGAEFQSDVKSQPGAQSQPGVRGQPGVTGQTGVVSPQVNHFNHFSHDCTSVPHHSMRYNSVSSPQFEAEQDKHSSAASKPSASHSLTKTNYNVAPKPVFESSEPLLQQLQYLSSSLKKDTENASKHSNVETEDNGLGSVSSSCNVRPCQSNTEYSTGNFGFTSPIAFKERNCDDSIKDCLPPPLEPTRRNEELPQFLKPSYAGSEPLSSSSFNRDSITKRNDNSDSEVSKSTELHAAGFVTLNSLMQDMGNTNQSEYRSKATKSVNEPSTNTSSDAVHSPVLESDNASGPKMNVHYMGSIPTNMDYVSFFQTLQDQGPCVVVDGSKSGNNVLQQLESLMGKGTSSCSEPKSKSPVLRDEGRSKKEKKSKKKKGIQQGSDYESVNSACSLGEKISRAAKKCKGKSPSPSKEKAIIGKSETDTDSSDRTIQEDPTLLSDSSTPVRLLKECSVVMGKLSIDGTASGRVLRSSKSTELVNNSEDDRSPSKKKLKSKKERDRRSVRKKKEEFAIDSSSDCNSYEGDGIPKLSDVRQQLVFKSVSNIPAALAAEGFDEACLVETGSESMSEAITSHKEQRKSMLDVNLHCMTESVDIQTKIVDDRLLSERLLLKPDIVQTVKNSLEKAKNRNVTYVGPMEVVSGIQIVGTDLYVSYQMNSIKCFNIQTGSVKQEFICQGNSINCMLVTQGETLNMYVGCGQSVMKSFNCQTGKLMRSEDTEGTIQCMHSDWGKLFLGTDIGTVIIKKIKKNKTIDSFICTDRPISCIASGREGTQKVLVIGAFDAVIYVYDSGTGLLIRMMNSHTHTPFSIQVDGHIVYSGSGDKTVMQHNLLTGELIWKCTDASSIVSSVCVSGDLLYSASYDRYIRCYNKKTRKLLKMYYGADIGLVTKMLVADGKLITGNRKGVVESISLHVSEEFPCQHDDCEFIFGVKSHLQHHAVHGHLLLNDKVFQCQWNGCGTKISVERDRQDAESHIQTHIY